MALECFKILYKLSPPCLNDLVVLKNSKRTKIEIRQYKRMKNC
jgi:hypothetical protein